MPSGLASVHKFHAKIPVKLKKTRENLPLINAINAIKLNQRDL